MQPSVIAHRGFSSIAPENTLAAIRLAMEANVDMIEVDLVQTADGVPVLLHDFTLNRTTSGFGEVKDFPLSQVQRFDAGQWFSPLYSGETVPTLEEALELVSGKCTLLLEIKMGSSYFPAIEENVGEIIRRMNASGWCIVQSFENEVVKTFRKKFPEIRIHKLVTGNLPVVPLHMDSRIKLGRIYKYVDVDAINISYRLLNRRKLRRIRERGQKVFVWTVNEEDDMRQMIRMGVDGIITDFPDRLMKVLAETRKSS